MTTHPGDGWQPIATAPKDGTRFRGALYWPTPTIYKRMATSVLREPAPGVEYRYPALVFWHEGAWRSAPPDCLMEQDQLYAWQSIELPEPPPKDKV